MKTTDLLIDSNNILDLYKKDRDSPEWGENVDLENNSDDDIVALQAVLQKIDFDDSSYKGLEDDLDHHDSKAQEIDTNRPELTANTEKDPLYTEIKKVLFNYDLGAVASPLFNDLIAVIRKKTSYFENQVDPALKDIDTSTPLSYWKQECPALFDYPDNKHGYKTSWEFLKGVYNPKKHKTLYYNDLKEINHKLYRAIYRQNSKEKFLPTHNDRVQEEINKLKSKNIKLSDIKNPKLKERYRMRFHMEN